jgi:hypothetical protein
MKTYYGIFIIGITGTISLADSYGLHVTESKAYRHLEQVGKPELNYIILPIHKKQVEA